MSAGLFVEHLVVPLFALNFIAIGANSGPAFKGVAGLAQVYAGKVIGNRPTFQCGTCAVGEVDVGRLKFKRSQVYGYFDSGRMGWQEEC